MTLIKVEKFDEVHIRVFSDPSTEQELSEFFKFPVPGAKWMPLFKAKRWDGFCRLYNLQTKKIYSGLIEYIKEFASRNDYELEIDDGIIYNEGITSAQVEGFARIINPCSKGNPIEIRDYQVDAIHKALNSYRTVLLSPTASGKSLIIYTLLRWFLAKGLTCIIIVPTTSLVEQLYSDFEDYSTGNGWSTSDNCQKLYSGLSKDFNSNVLITTWQSTFKLSKDWCNQFDVVFSDECHLAKASSLTGMFENMTDVKYRIGTTGTIDNSQVNQLQLEGIMGPLHRVITTKQLMDSNRVVQLDIKCLLLKYPEEVRKLHKGMKYQDEMDFLVSHEGRNKFITNLALKQDGNTLVLFQFVAKHGKILHKMIVDRAEDGRQVFYVSGEVKTEDREYIRKATENEFDGKIFTFKGIDIKVPNNEKIKMTSGEVKFAKDITLNDDVCDIWIANKIKLSFVKQHQRS